MGTNLESIATVRNLARKGLPPEVRKEVEGDELMALILEANAALSEGADYSSGDVYRVTGAPRGAEGIAFPTILSGATEIALPISQAVDELGLLSELAEPQQQSDLFLYSVQVLTPSTWSWPQSGPSPETIHENAGRQAELKTGYVYYEVFQRMTPASRRAFLTWLLEHADSIQVSVRGVGPEGVSHVRINLEAA